MKRVFILAIALLLIPLARTAVAAPAGKAAAPLTRLQIKGMMQSTEIYGTNFPAMSVNANGSGSATLVGEFTLTYQGQVNFMDLATVEVAHLTAANGDRIDLTGVGQATESSTPSIFNIVQVYKITGGTGRFDEAQGTITLNRIVYFTSGFTSGTFEGYILVP